MPPGSRSDAPLREGRPPHSCRVRQPEAPGGPRCFIAAGGRCRRVSGEVGILFRMRFRCVFIPSLVAPLRFCLGSGTSQFHARCGRALTWSVIVNLSSSTLAPPARSNFDLKGELLTTWRRALSNGANRDADVPRYRGWYRSAGIDEISCVINELAQPLIIEWE